MKYAEDALARRLSLGVDHPKTAQLREPALLKRKLADAIL